MRKKILILFLSIFFFDLVSSRPQRDEDPVPLCPDFADQGYQCSFARLCATSKCRKETEDEIIPEKSDVNEVDIRSPVAGINNPCLNTEQVKQLTALACPERRAALEDDELVCCHSSNIIKDDVAGPEPPSTVTEAARPSSPTVTESSGNPENFGRRCGTHVEKGLSPRQNAIVKTDTEAGEWPHMCAIFKFNSGRPDKGVFLAGASLIAPGIVLTVAHWVADLGASEISVRCGIWNITGNQFEEREVSQITVHPAYDQASVRNDYGLLHLKKDFVLSSTIETICLPGSRNSRNEFDPSNCVATGWGRESHGDSGRIPDLLKQIRLPIVDQVACQAEVRKEYGDSFVLHPSFICAGGEPGRDTCRGDGGGPLVCKRPGADNIYVQAGIVSWGIKCGQPNTPGIYASTSFGLCFIDWATKCIHGNKYNDFYNLEPECSNWAVEEKESLEKQIARFKKVISDGGSKETLVDYVQKELPKYETALKNLETLQGSCGIKKDFVDPRNEDPDSPDIRSGIPKD